MISQLRWAFSYGTSFVKCKTDTLLSEIFGWLKVVLLTLALTALPEPYSQATICHLIPISFVTKSVEGEARQLLFIWRKPNGSQFIGSPIIPIFLIV